MEYNSTQDDYIYDTTPLRTFGCQVYINILTGKSVKRRKKGTVGDQKGYFVRYITTNIYRLYFPDTGKVEIIRDVKLENFKKNDDSLQAYRRGW